MLKHLLAFLLPCLILVPLRVSAAGPASERRSYHVVVYGGTASGAIAAISAAQRGASVALLEPGRHLGGMVTGGLGHTDFLRQDHLIGGLALEFFQRVGSRYGQPLVWKFEPGVAERVLNEWVASAGVQVFFTRRIWDVQKENGRLQSLRTEDGSFWKAQVYIDASYEGDLMKAAGVGYSIGRESRNKYGEMLAGRQELLPGHHQFRVNVPDLAENSPFSRYIVPLETAPAVGEGDGKVQGYGFRLCLTTLESNRVPLGKPAGYDPHKYDLVRAYAMALGSSAEVRDFLGISRIPNGKTDINSTGPVSTNLLGAAWEYPEASYQRRQEIWAEHLEWAKGLLYFLSTDEAVPEKVRLEVGRYGLAKDEFLDTGHWPHQLYVRDARRMKGAYILTERDLLKDRTKPDSIGMGGYNIDIREVEWVSTRVYHFPNVRRQVFMEGYLSYPVEPYEIPYRSLLPSRTQVSNLLVTSCISASAVAYASFRMEPQYMIVGQAAGAAAWHAIREGRDLHDIDIAELQRVLRKEGQILTLREARHLTAVPASKE